MRWGLLILALGGLRAETIDRIAVSIGKQVIAESQVIEEVRVTAFLEGEKPDLSGPGKRKAAERLVERTLISRELVLNRYVLPEAKDVDRMLDQVKARYPSEEVYRAALAEAGLTAEQLIVHLQLQLQLLRFIDYRFRPGVQISDEDIQELYEKQASDWKRKHSEPAPTLEASRADIVSLLTRERADRGLDRWLGEARTREQIVYRENVFR